MRILNIISIVSVFAIVSNSDAMMKDSPVHMGTYSGFHEFRMKFPEVSKVHTHTAVLIQQRPLSSFLSNPYFTDKRGKICPIFLDDELRRKLDVESRNTKKQNRDGSMTQKLVKAVQEAALYDTADDVESTSFVLYGGDIYTQGNAPI